MEQRIITTYAFSELSEEAKEHAIYELRDINVDYEWFDFIYEDLKIIGLTCKGFDIDSRSYCNLEAIESYVTIAVKILNHHGETCNTYRIALQFLEIYRDLDYKLNRLCDMYHTTSCSRQREEWLNEKIDLLESQLEELKAEFHKDLEYEYLSLLKRDYEYLTSEKAIIETIEANSYEFDENGNLF